MAVSLLILLLAGPLVFINALHLLTHANRQYYNSVIKSVTLTSLLVALFSLLIMWKFEILVSVSAISASLVWNSLFNVTLNFSLLLLTMSIFIMVLVLLYLWYSGISTVFVCNIVLIISMAIVGAFTANNVFIFLIFFELSSLPIFVLLAYSGSMRRERLKAMYYFLFFTLYGSLSLLFVILSIYVLMVTGMEGLTLYDERVLWILVFLAFAIKLPLFPFHIWLPYAHVEASTITSVILAALLLKLGGYGIVKFMLPMFLVSTHLYFRPFVLGLSIIGLIYGSFCAMRQIDLKRQIAFLSVAHMNFAAIGIFTLTTVGINGAIYMMVSHGLISGLYFFLIGMLSERYHTRSIMAFSGLWSVMPVYSAFLLFVILANIGFPGLSGFIPEFLILSGIISSIPSIVYYVLFGMIITTVAGLVSGLRLLFGGVKVSYTGANFVDLTYLEFTIVLSLVVTIVVLGLYNIFV